MNTSACVNWRWYSRNNSGSVGELMKTSRSGAMPARQPSKAAARSFSRANADCGTTAPIAPWLMGSMDLRLSVLGEATGQYAKLGASHRGTRHGRDHQRGGQATRPRDARPGTRGRRPYRRTPGGSRRPHGPVRAHGGTALGQVRADDRLPLHARSRAARRPLEFSPNAAGLSAVDKENRKPGQFLIQQLARHHRLFRDLAVNPAAVALIRHMVGDDATRFSSHNSFVKWQDDFGYGPTLGLHCDQTQMPRPWGRAALTANTNWCLTDYTKEGGSFAYVPGSHRLGPSPRPTTGGEPRRTGRVRQGIRDRLPRRHVARRVSPPDPRHAPVDRQLLPPPHGDVARGHSRDLSAANSQTTATTRRSSSNWPASTTGSRMPSRARPCRSSPTPDRGLVRQPPYRADPPSSEPLDQGLYAVDAGRRRRHVPHRHRRPRRAPVDVRPHQARLRPAAPQRQPVDDRVRQGP